MHPAALSSYQEDARPKALVRHESKPYFSAAERMFAVLGHWVAVLGKAIWSRANAAKSN